jgi:hypothetical protein
MITESSTSRKPAQMVWGSIWVDEGDARRGAIWSSWNATLMHHIVATQPGVTWGLWQKDSYRIGGVHTCSCKMGLVYTARVLFKLSSDSITSTRLTGPVEFMLEEYPK